MKSFITTIRLSPQGKDALRTIAIALGISQTAVIELALREYAQKKGITHAPRTTTK